MFAIVDLSSRTSRGQILMVVDDLVTANAIAWELNNLSTKVTVQPLTTVQLEQVQASRQVTPPGALRRAIA